MILPGRAALAKWALAEGCPRERDFYYNMAHAAAQYGHLELVKWLCGEGGFEMGGPSFVMVMRYAIQYGHVEVLRWVRENGCIWDAYDRDKAAAKLGYTDDFGNLVDGDDIDEYSDEYSDDEQEA